jgi:hypothetical protein
MESDGSDSTLRLRRRTLIRRGLAGAAVLGLGGLTVTQCTGYDLPADARPSFLSVKEYLVLAAACGRILDGLDVPDIARDAALWADGYLARQTPWVQGDVRLLLHAFEHAPPVFIGALSRFTRLEPQSQDRYLRAWQTSSIPAMKQGFQALKGLACMGGYRRSAALLKIGYDGPGAA